MIDIIKYDEEDVLPISVIVPLSKKRENFFYENVFPMIEANMCAEIIINDNDESAPKKRNDGFDKSSQPYVFFCDDDCVLPTSHLNKLYTKLNNSKYAFAYSGYLGIVVHPNTHPLKNNFHIPTKKFNYNDLLRGNYISTMSLIKRNLFPRFDESLKRLQDWDLWLTITKNGEEGIAVFDNDFFAYYLDEGITSNSNNERDAIMRIIKKHNIGI